jgi:hypothetical protein
MISRILLAVMLSSPLAAQSNPPYAVNHSVPVPTVFAPGVISTGDYETHAEFTPDGKSVYFLKNSPDFAFWTIYVSHFRNSKWSSPAIAPFSGHYRDADPFITPDGKRMFFISARPVQPGGKQKTDMDIWFMDLEPTGEWGEPHHLPAPVNSDKDEYFPRLASDGTLYFGSEREGGHGGSDIWRAKVDPSGHFLPPENLGDAINSAEDEYEALIAPDRSFMLVMAKRKDGLGQGDFYISYNRDGLWTRLKNIGAPINSAGYEFGPKISPDGKYLFFSSTRSKFNGSEFDKFTTKEYEDWLHSPGNGLGDIYFVDLSALHLEAPHVSKIQQK